MSLCDRGPLTPRRRLAAIVAGVIPIFAAAPILLRHSGPSDGTDRTLTAVVAAMLAIGIGIVVLLAVKRLRAFRR